MPVASTTATAVLAQFNQVTRELSLSSEAPPLVAAIERVLAKGQLLDPREWS